MAIARLPFKVLGIDGGKSYLIIDTDTNEVAREEVFPQRRLVSAIVHATRLNWQRGLLQQAQVETSAPLTDERYACAKNRQWLGGTEVGANAIDNSKPANRTFLTSDLCKELDVRSPTLNKYAKAAGVGTPRRGQRDFRYSEADRERILEGITDTSSDTKLVERCRELIEKKPKARN